MPKFKVYREGGGIGPAEDMWEAGRGRGVHELADGEGRQARAQDHYKLEADGLSLDSTASIPTRASATSTSTSSRTTSAITKDVRAKLDAWMKAKKAAILLIEVKKVPDAATLKGKVLKFMATVKKNPPTSGHAGRGTCRIRRSVVETTMPRGSEIVARLALGHLEPHEVRRGGLVDERAALGHLRIAPPRELGDEHERLAGAVVAELHHLIGLELRALLLAAEERRGHAIEALGRQRLERARIEVCGTVVPFSENFARLWLQRLREVEARARVAVVVEVDEAAGLDAADLLDGSVQATGGSSLTAQHSQLRRSRRRGRSFLRAAM